MLKHHLFINFLFILQVLCNPASAFNIDTTKVMEVPSISNKLFIDGKLDEMVWHGAAIADGFRQILPEHSLNASFPTRVMMMQDKKFLYIGVFCFDTTSLVFSSVYRDFNEVQMDFFGVVIDGFNDGRIGMAFLVNPGGAQKDLMVFDDIYFDEQWDGVWIVKTSQSDSGWQAEIAIPWETLRYKNNNADWRINFFRRISSKNEVSAWSLYPRFASPYRLQFAGILKVKPPPAQMNFRVQPYGLSNHYYSSIGNVKDRSTDMNSGVDVKWAFTPKDVLDITINTDFAQADVDRQIVNLSRSSIYLPERRAFFQENAALFSEGMKADGPIGAQMQIIPFLSRRVGLDSSGSFMPIRYGGRYIHRSSLLNYGAMFISQKEAGGDRSFLTGRITKNIGQQNRIGLLHSSEIKNSETLSTTSADGFFRIGTMHSMKAMWSKTYGRFSSSGISQFIQYDYKSNNVIAAFRGAYVSKGYNPTMGFVSRSDALYFGPMVYLTVRPRWIPRKVLFYEPVLMSDIFYKASTGRLQEYSITGVPLWFTFKNGSSAAIFGLANYQNVDEDLMLQGLTIRKGNYRYYQGGTIVNTSPFKVFSLQSVLLFGSFYNGNIFNADFTVYFRPSARLLLMTQLQSYILNQVGIAAESRSIHLIFQHLRYAITPRMIISSMAQMNLQTNHLGVNIRYAWEFKPLSFLYFIYTVNDRSQNHIMQREHGVITKISYLHQF